MIEFEKGQLSIRLLSLSYLGLLVVLPILTLISIMFKSNPTDIWAHITHPHALYSLKITFFYALCIAVINSVTGTATAWVLIRYDFPFKNTINTLIDLPFAIPTVVTGIMLVTIYGPQSFIGRSLADKGIHIIYNQPGIILALAFVTFPFVVRAVQPVIIEMEHEMEEAAQTLGASPWKIFSKIILPSLSPAIMTGTALSFSRALGEFGSIVMVAGNIPMKTQVSSVYIYGEVESGNIPGAMGISLILLILSFLIILLLNFIQKWKRKYEQGN
jgi:sulfate transport system permease protein